MDRMMVGPKIIGVDVGGNGRKDGDAGRRGKKVVKARLAVWVKRTRVAGKDSRDGMQRAKNMDEGGWEGGSLGGKERLGGWAKNAIPVKSSKVTVEVTA